LWWEYSDTPPSKSKSNTTGRQEIDQNILVKLWWNEGKRAEHKFATTGQVHTFSRIKVMADDGEFIDSEKREKLGDNF
jgi:hypothetical protein